MRYHGIEVNPARAVQADIRIVKQTQAQAFTWWLWVENGWYEKADGEDLAVIVNGTLRPYNLKNEQYVFAQPE